MNCLCVFEFTECTEYTDVVVLVSTIVKETLLGLIEITLFSLCPKLSCIYHHQDTS